MLFFIIQLLMSSFAYRATYKMAPALNQAKKNMFEENSLNQNRQMLIFEVNRNNHALGNSLTRIEVSAESLMDQIEIYEWRSNTDYPIVNCNWKRVIFNKSPSFIANSANKARVIYQVAYRHPLQIASLWVENEPIVPLEQYQVLSIAQFLYAFKETLVGFERLFALFGSFEIIPGMVGVNLEGRVKVWVSRHYQTNAKLEIDQMSLLGKEQQYMVSKIKGLLMKNTCDSSTFREFFKLLETSNTFIECLKLIEDFSISKRIILSRKIMKKYLQVQKRPLSPIINLKPIARTPKFIAYMQHRKTQLQESIPSLYFNPVIETSKNYHFSQLKTQETSNQGDIYELTDDSLIKAGKIVKNKGKNCLLNQARSLENLHELKTKPKTHTNIEGSSIFQQMKRLLEDDPETEAESGKKYLTQLGRQVRESITLL